MKNKILVTGSHRSGSTWVGKMLSLGPRVGYVHEPFNLICHPGLLDTPFQYWYMYINNQKYDDYLTFRFGSNYSWLDKFRNLESPKNLLGGIIESTKFLFQKIFTRKTIIKDPIAFFSSPYLFENFSMQIVVIARHPAAFVSSLKKTNWEFDFNNLLSQKKLVKDWLQDYKEQIEEYSKNKYDIIDQGILIWNILHITMLEFKRKYPTWNYVRHEDLSANPVREFRKLYSNLSLEWSQSIEKKILSYTEVGNPKQIKTTHSITVDSKKNIYSWKERLSDKEIDRIRLGTSIVSKHFYKKEEW